MRILQISSAGEIGGGERHVSDLINSLAARGHPMFAAINPRSPLRELVRLPEPNVIELPMRNALSVRSALKLSQFVRENRIEIVHAHVARDYPLAALAAGHSKAHLVLTRHVIFPLGRVHRLTLRRTARVIAVSRPVADALRAQKIFPPEIITVIHNGIDVSRFEKRRGSRHDRLRVGTIGELSPNKGHDDFIRAASSLCARRSDVEFIIAGIDKSHRNENRARLEKQIDDLGLSDRISLKGWIEDVSALLATWDVFVSAARSEGFGLAIVEAMAAGLPVVATMSEGAREIMASNQIGLLVPVGDVNAMAEAIGELLDNEPKRGELALKGRAFVQENFTLERMINRIEALYREVVDRLEE